MLFHLPRVATSCQRSLSIIRIASPTFGIPYTLSSRYSLSHGEITCMKVSNSACLMAR